MSEEQVPKFFFPASRSPEEAEANWQSIRAFAQKTTGWQPTERRVYKVKYRHNGRYCEAAVGELHPADKGQEPVCAILETPECWLVCTPYRGVISGEPIMIGIPHSAVEFAQD